MADAEIHPYLFFGGRCAEALAFYERALDAEVTYVMRYKDAPEPPPPGMEERVMHASFRVGGALLQASDGCDDAPRFAGFRISLALPDEAAVRRACAGLADGGAVEMAPERTFWSPCFGMVTDRFGVGWMVAVTAA